MPRRAKGQGDIAMALCGNAYAVDLTAMRKACGSKDEGPLSAIMNSQIREIRRLAEQLDEDDDSGFPFRQALADIVAGVYQAPPSRCSLYGYAIEVLCGHFGEAIPVPGDEDFGEIGDPADLEIDTPLVNGGLPLPVPAWGDTPYVRFLSPEQVVEGSERLSHTDLSHEDDAIAEGREILRYQLQWARERGRAYIAVVNGLCLQR